MYFRGSERGILGVLTTAHVDHNVNKYSTCCPLAVPCGLRVLGNANPKPFTLRVYMSSTRCWSL